MSCIAQLWIKCITEACMLLADLVSTACSHTFACRQIAQSLHREDSSCTKQSKSQSGTSCYAPNICLVCQSLIDARPRPTDLALAMQRADLAVHDRRRALECTWACCDAARTVCCGRYGTQVHSRNPWDAKDLPLVVSATRLCSCMVVVL